MVTLLWPITSRRTRIAGIDLLLLKVSPSPARRDRAHSLHHANVRLAPKLAWCIGQGFGPDLLLSGGEMGQWVLDQARCDGSGPAGARHGRKVPAIFFNSVGLGFVPRRIAAR